MQIQRIQTIYLLVAAVLMGVISFTVPATSAATESGEVINISMYEAGMWPLIILNLATCLLIVVNIFKYNTLKLQMSVAKICELLIFAAIVLEICLPMGAGGVTTAAISSIVMYVAAMLFDYLALCGMRKDYRTIHSDSLWR